MILGGRCSLAFKISSKITLIVYKNRFFLPNIPFDDTAGFRLFTRVFVYSIMLWCRIQAKTETTISFLDTLAIYFFKSTGFWLWVSVISGRWFSAHRTQKIFHRHLHRRIGFPWTEPALFRVLISLLLYMNHNSSYRRPQKTIDLLQPPCGSSSSSFFIIRSKRKIFDNFSQKQQTFDLWEPNKYAPPQFPALWRKSSNHTPFHHRHIQIQTL